MTAQFFLSFHFTYSIYLFTHIFKYNSSLGPVPERLISAYPGLKFCSVFCIFPTYALLGVTFCVIITVSRSKGLTAFCKLELHVLRQK